MTFYLFRQNNSGGSFSLTDELTHFVFIEAETPEEANAILVSKGGYFDGCRNGWDCSCCGDRWYRAEADDASESPTIDGESIEEYMKGPWFLQWMAAGREVVVHYADGRSEWF